MPPLEGGDETFSGTAENASGLITIHNLTPWSRVILENSPVNLLFKDLPTFYVT
jgi:hypothetical protein